MMGASTTMTSIAFTPLLPWAAIGTFAALAVGLTAYAFMKRATGAGWRAVALAIGIGALANPTLNNENRDLLNDVVAVVVDHSPSQRIGDRLARTDEALRVIEERIGVSHQGLVTGLLAVVVVAGFVNGLIVDIVLKVVDLARFVVRHLRVSSLGETGRGV